MCSVCPEWWFRSSRSLWTREQPEHRLIDSDRCAFWQQSQSKSFGVNMSGQHLVLPHLSSVVFITCWSNRLPQAIALFLSLLIHQLAHWRFPRLLTSPSITVLLLAIVPMQLLWAFHMRRHLPEISAMDGNSWDFPNEVRNMGGQLNGGHAEPLRVAAFRHGSWMILQIVKTHLGPPDELNYLCFF